MVQKHKLIETIECYLNSNEKFNSFIRKNKFKNHMQLHYVRYYLQHKSADEYLKTKALKSVENSLISKEIDEVLRNKKSCFQSAVDLNLESASSFMMKVVNARKNLYNVNMKRKRVVTKDSDTKKYIRELEERVELLEATIAFNEELKQRVNFRLKQQKKK